MCLSLILFLFPFVIWSCVTGYCCCLSAFFAGLGLRPSGSGFNKLVERGNYHTLYAVAYAVADLCADKSRRSKNETKKSFSISCENGKQ